MIDRLSLRAERPQRSNPQLVMSVFRRLFVRLASLLFIGRQLFA
jgi:hypothetical protein